LLHAIISNAKAFINGTLRGHGDRHLQRRFNEFFYLFNQGNSKVRAFSGCPAYVRRPRRSSAGYSPGNFGSQKRLFSYKGKVRFDASQELPK
jgi:hypothetical protein